MRISIVTISFNQGAFLKACLDSVVNQSHPDVEYIVVDPGSTDGSRALIESYGDRITKPILEPDAGPIDGLNKGFAHATGDILGFLNADDVLLPGALATIASFFETHPRTDVVSGHGWVIDDQGRRHRRFFSDRFSLRRHAYGRCALLQQATFFRRDAFDRAGGFREGDGVCWDSELWVDMAEQGARFERMNVFLALFRIHPQSISDHPATLEKRRAYQRRLFTRVMGRRWRWWDRPIRAGLRMPKYASNPRDLVERLRRGSIFSLPK